jgi:hypothetical protein
MENNEELQPRRNSTTTGVVAVVIFVLVLAAIFFVVSSKQGDRNIVNDERDDVTETPTVPDSGGITTEAGNEAGEGEILPAGQSGSDANLQVD